MSAPYIHVLPGNPDFLDLDWSRPIEEWTHVRVVDLPTGVHRHPVRFVAYDEGIYALKELPLRLARHEFDVLRSLGERVTSVVSPVSVVERPWLDSSVEGAGVIITDYVRSAFTYHELIEAGGFGRRRDQLLGAFAGLLVELHLGGCFWGDCSLSNVLYRYDAGTIEAIMIDAETVELHEQLSEGQRLHDIEIMILNVAGGMADIAASQGIKITDADLALGEDIASRYELLWRELTEDVTIRSDERFRIRQRVRRMHDLGFEVSDIELIPTDDGTDRLRLHVSVVGRNYHSNRLRELTRIDASKNQARRILEDLRHHEAKTGSKSATDKAVAAIRWRVDVFEPLIARIAADVTDRDPVQAYTDFLHHRYLMATELGRDVANDDAYERWRQESYPGRLADNTP